MQPSLITVAANVNVLRPSNDQQWQLFRGTEPAGSGTYHAMNKNGVVENIGGGVVDLTPLIFDIEQNENFKLTAVPRVGNSGTPPYTYSWKVVDNFSISGADSYYSNAGGSSSYEKVPLILSDTNLPTCSTNISSGATAVTGLVRLDVFDINNKHASAYYYCNKYV